MNVVDEEDLEEDKNDMLRMCSVHGPTLKTAFTLGPVDESKGITDAVVDK
jgi:hypothetical protein